MDTKKNLNSKLSKVLATLFENSSFPREAQGNTIEVFNENLYSLLQQSLDITITNEKLVEYKSIDQNDPIAQIRFISSTLDNDTTYTLLNYYMVETIKVYVEGANATQKKEIATLLQSNGLTSEELDQVERSYHDFIQHKPQQTS